MWTSLPSGRRKLRIRWRRWCGVWECVCWCVEGVVDAARVGVEEDVCRLGVGGVDVISLLIFFIFYLQKRCQASKRQDELSNGISRA